MERIQSLEWSLIEENPTRGAIQAFLNKYPDGRFTETANAKLEYIENQFWSAVIKVDDIESYQNYLNEYPEGNHSNLARKIIRDKRIEIKRKLFSDFDRSLISFLNKEEESSITEIDGKKNISLFSTDEDVNVGCFGGEVIMTEYGTYVKPGTKVGFTSDKFKIIGIAGDPKKKDNKLYTKLICQIEEVFFEAGLEITFSTGERYTYDGTEWGEDIE
jgi:hypothetical protein